MNYCSIEEAWGDELQKKKKKKKNRLYKTHIPEYIEDSSYEDGIHNNHCEDTDNNNFNVKNRERHSHGRKARPIKKSKQKNVEISYNDANREYKRYRKETKRMKESARKKNIIEEENMAPGMFSGFNNEEQLHDFVSENNINTEQDNIYSGQEVDYNKIQDEGLNNEDYLNTQNLDLIEGFESNGEDLDSHNISNKKNIKDVNTKAGNLIDRLLDNSKQQMSPSSEEMSSDEGQNNTDSDIATTDEEVPKKELIPIDNKKISKKDIDYRLNSLNRSMNMIIKQMNKSQFFDDESEDNIHDLILFILFGIFIIFILDSIYKLGKRSSSIY
jgi:hypothetical protein